MNISVIGIDEIVLPESVRKDLGTGARPLPRPHWCNHRLGSSGVVEEISEPRSQDVLAAAVAAPAVLVAILVLNIEKSRQISPNHPTTLSDITYALRNLAKQVPQASASGSHAATDFFSASATLWPRMYVLSRCVTYSRTPRGVCAAFPSVAGSRFT